MNFSEYMQLMDRAEAAGIGDDKSLDQLLHILQFKEVVKKANKRTMQELGAWEANIANTVESRIKLAEKEGEQ